MSEEIQPTKKKKGFVKWIKRLGVAGFLFFLIKGLVWIAIFAGVLKYAGCDN